jgi:hypothetical protein
MPAPTLHKPLEGIDPEHKLCPEENDKMCRALFVSVLACLGLTQWALPVARADERPSTIATYYTFPGYNPLLVRDPLAAEPLLTTAQASYASMSSTYARPDAGPFYLPTSRRRDTGFRVTHIAAGPLNFYRNLNDYYPSVRYWNYYYPGY